MTSSTSDERSFLKNNDGLPVNTQNPSFTLLLSNIASRLNAPPLRRAAGTSCQKNESLKEEELSAKNVQGVIFFHKKETAMGEMKNTENEFCSVIDLDRKAHPLFMLTESLHSKTLLDDIGVFSPAERAVMNKSKDKAGLHFVIPDGLGPMEMTPEEEASALEAMEEILAFWSKNPI